MQPATTLPAMMPMSAACGRLPKELVSPVRGKTAPVPFVAFTGPVLPLPTSANDDDVGVIVLVEVILPAAPAPPPPAVA